MNNWIFLYEDNFHEGRNMSIVLHEIGHALDFALGINTYLSDETPEIFKGGTPLDWYANSNNIERFATCFESLFNHEDSISTDYFDHTIKEVFYKENEFFNFMTSFLRIDKK